MSSPPKTPCTHPINVGGLCGHCGYTIPPRSANTSPVPNTASSKLTLGTHTIHISDEFKTSNAAKSRLRMSSKKKLSLVLDLDHTLVHAVANPLASQYCTGALSNVRTFLLPEESAPPSVVGGVDNLFSCTDPRYTRRHYISLRPSLIPVLQTLQEYYEFTIYTAGNRYYALKVAHAIARAVVGAPDVDGFTGATATALEKSAIAVKREMFGSRIISRSDVHDLGSNVKSLERVFPDGGELSVILDDREDVWAAAYTATKDTAKTIEAANAAYIDRPGEPPYNCLAVQPYKFHGFTMFDDVNNKSGMDVTKSGENEGGGEDEQLVKTQDILIRLHTSFYAQSTAFQGSTLPKIVPYLLRDMRRSVLAGVTIVFSGLVPLTVPGRGSGGGTTSMRPRNDYVRYAEELGATVVNAVSGAVTHCVAGLDGTDKVNRAAKIVGCKVVTVGWLMEAWWWCKKGECMKYLLRPVLMGGGGVGEGPAVAATVAPVAEKRKRRSEEGSTAVGDRCVRGRNALSQEDITSRSTSPSSASGSSDDEDFAQALLDQIC